MLAHQPSEMTMPKAKSDKAATPKKLGTVGKKTGVELTESQLDKVTGGAADIFAKLGDIKGESYTTIR
jgi:hypothetical protein